MEKRHTIRMSEDTARRLKIMAARCGLSQGGLLQHFLLALQDWTNAASDNIDFCAVSPQFLRRKCPTPHGTIKPDGKLVANRGV
ncbi:MAG: hypothetical protein EOM03_16700 [Clostridia bacterium]|nr:hypothetical protein [Clostridia bacterium]